MPVDFKSRILAAQKAEITEHFIYKRLAGTIKDRDNRKVLNRISSEELSHYNIWKEKTKKEIGPSYFKVWWYALISKIFGITFGVKIMEAGEGRAQTNYKEIAKEFPEAKKIKKEEEIHEKELIDLIEEERLEYIGSMVLGLHDALIEMTGVLAGLTLALQNSKLIVLSGVITGIAASLSMGASEYLSNKADESRQNPLKAAAYTGFIYLFAVAFLVFPYLIFSSVYQALALTVFNAFVLLFIFTFYISVAKSINFKKRLLEMAGITFFVAGLTFCIGFLVRIFLGVNI